MTDKSTPTKKEDLTNSKNSLQEQTVLTTPPQEQTIANQNLLNQNDNFQKIKILLLK